MEKTKEEIIKDLIYKYQIFTLKIGELVDQSYEAGKKAGFESCREKVEEGVKELIVRNGTGYAGQENWTLNTVLTTIKEIKE